MDKKFETLHNLIHSVMSLDMISLVYRIATTVLTGSPLTLQMKGHGYVKNYVLQITKWCRYWVTLTSFSAEVSVKDHHSLFVKEI